MDIDIMDNRDGLWSKTSCHIEEVEMKSVWNVQAVGDSYLVVERWVSISCFVFVNIDIECILI